MPCIAGNFGPAGILAQVAIFRDRQQMTQLQAEMKGAQQEHDLRLAMTLGTNPTAEANIGLDEHEGQRQCSRLSL